MSVMHPGCAGLVPAVLNVSELRVIHRVGVTPVRPTKSRVRRAWSAYPTCAATSASGASPPRAAAELILRTVCSNRINPATALGEGPTSRRNSVPR